MQLLLLLITTFVLSGTSPGVDYSFLQKKRADKLLLVTINESGIVTVNNDTVDTDHLAPYIQERLFKSYLGTGKMHDKIVLQKKTDAVPQMVIDVIIKEIQAGQQRALAEVCVQKYRKRFDSLDTRKQDKVKKQFPVLFQPAFL